MPRSAAPSWLRATGPKYLPSSRNEKIPRPGRSQNGGLRMKLYGLAAAHKAVGSEFVPTMHKESSRLEWLSYGTPKG